MEVKVNKKTSGIVELEIEISAEETQPYLEKAARRLAGEINFEGFREGKAPFEVVKKRVGEVELLGEALDLMVPEKLQETITKEKLDIAGQPKVEILKMAPENPVSFKATFELMPEVKLGDLTQIKLEREKVEIKDEKVEQVLEDIRKMRAKELAVTRAAKLGDKLTVDIDMSIGGVALEGGQGRDTVLILGESYLVPGLDEELVGVAPQGVKNFSLPYPEDYYDKKLAGKKVDFKVSVKNIMEVILPELNDEFVKGLGNFENIESLKNKIKENLDLEEKEKAEQKLEGKIFEELVKNTEFTEIPKALVERELERMVRELEAGVANEGMKFEDYLIQLKKSEEDLKKDFASGADRRIKVALALRELIKREKIEVAPEEVEKEIQSMLKNCGTDEKLKKQVDSKDYRLYMEDVILNRKAMEWLKLTMVKV